ncbi:Hypothetical predicted protein [Mytilus galloprovincialis]|uniref:Uncharacterized protein n=1 Tax=Mytilus galloprovincialis TaxID=29158 RepID=A0A8B6FVT4_MYTGA|nr:Hypothetical predicted protein [Mytilus galloprovincialis]
MKKWITPGTWKVIEERRHMNKKILDTKSERLQERHKASNRVLDKNVKQMARADKRAYMEDLAKQAEEAAEKGEQGKIYKITREICGKFRNNNDVHIIDKNGRLLTTEDEQKARWAEHFKEILNRLPPDDKAIVIEALQDLEVNINSPDRQEIFQNKRLKNWESLTDGRRQHTDYNDVQSDKRCQVIAIVRTDIYGRVARASTSFPSKSFHPFT